MALKRLAVQIGQGTSLRSGDYTKASCRAVEDAIRHNFLSVAQAFNFPRESMIIDVEIGVQEPDKVDKNSIAKVLPYGKVNVIVTKGGIDIPIPEEPGKTVTANAAVVVYFDMEEKKWKELF